MLEAFTTIPWLHQDFPSNYRCIPLRDQSQGTIGKDLPIAYTCRLLNKTEQAFLP